MKLLAATLPAIACRSVSRSMPSRWTTQVSDPLRVGQRLEHAAMTLQQRGVPADKELERPDVSSQGTSADRCLEHAARGLPRSPDGRVDSRREDQRDGMRPNTAQGRPPPVLAVPHSCQNGQAAAATHGRSRGMQPRLSWAPAAGGLARPETS
jgi:hypothetical protein